MKCKLCPRKKVCRGGCYDEPACEFALAFDKLGRKINRLNKRLQSYEKPKEETP